MEANVISYFFMTIEWHLSHIYCDRAVYIMGQIFSECTIGNVRHVAKRICRTFPIGRVRRNSGGKRQAYYQQQVSTSTRQAYRLLIAVDFCLILLTSAKSAGQ